MSRIGEKLKNIRIEQGLSQKQLAKKLGVAESFINEVEMGRKVINEALIKKISKVLGKDINDISMSFEEEAFNETEKEVKTRKVTAASNNISDNKEVQEIWSDAFGSVLRSVPILKYNLKDVVGSRQLPLISNKIEGHAPDKVLYLNIEDDDMLGFRIAKGDLALAHVTHELENNSICLVEFNSERVLRQIKKLDNTKVLLISNRGTLRTETANIKEVNILAKLDRLEIKL